MMVVVLGWEKRVMRDLRPRLLNAWKEYLLRGVAIKLGEISRNYFVASAKIGNVNLCKTS
jgi:hypothetical protein